LARRSGDADSPRMLGAFNEATPDGSRSFMFTYFTDRDGKMQLHSLAQSGFDPLSRTCRFMLTRRRITCSSRDRHQPGRACEPAKDEGRRHQRSLHVRQGPRARRGRSSAIQKKLNLHYTHSLDLFGSEVPPTRRTP